MVVEEASSVAAVREGADGKLAYCTALGRGAELDPMVCYGFTRIA